MTGYGAGVFPHHAAMLRASAIAEDVAAERGYVSVDTRRRLALAGFKPYQHRIPGLLIPVHDTSGAVALWQYRPDSPRVNRKGKPVKYETPGGRQLVMDVPPRIRGQLADPKVPLWVTEGIRKADAAVSTGLCCVALLGVQGWRGTNTLGGKTALPAWHDIALNGRRVYIAYDSDAMTNPKVHTALADIGGYLAYKGAGVRYVYQPAAGDTKIGLDDYLAGGGSIDALITSAQPRPREPERARADNEDRPIPRAAPSHLHTPPAWASDQDILTRLVRDAGKWCGFTGEHRNAKLTYLAITSRVLDDPVSIAVKGLSSSGKSYTIATVLRFFPDEAVITMTAMSERALIYMEDDFSHRTLVLFEAVALREEREKTESNLTAYIVRSLLSEGEIRYPVAARDEGKTVTRWIIKKGPTNFIVTTTATSLHGENETRMLSLPTDDSAAQTTSIMKAIAVGQRPEADFSEWHALARWIAAGNTNVVIPYAEWLAANIPPVAVRLRRDFRALLRLIEAHAIVHQLNRANDEQGRIVATETDYLAVRELVADLISDAVGSTVSATVRETVETVAKLDSAAEGVKVHALAEHLGLERSTVQYRVTAAKEKGYLVNVEEKRGRAARWRTGTPLPEDVVILPERIEGVNPHPEPASHTPAEAEPQVSDSVDGGCEGVNQPRGGDCAECGEPLDPALVQAGFTTHGEETQP